MNPRNTTLPSQNLPEHLGVCRGLHSHGQDVEQRQIHLNAACSAWNIACNHPESGRNLDHFMRSYKGYNPNADEAALAAYAATWSI